MTISNADSIGTSSFTSGVYLARTAAGTTRKPLLYTKIMSNRIRIAGDDCNEDVLPQEDPAPKTDHDTDGLSYDIAEEELQIEMYLLFQMSF